MPSLLRKVKSRLFISSRRHAFHQLDGQYRSQARARGSDFDDLREYAAGDDVRDIDWNATARSGATLIRRYRAERTQIVTFLVDTGRSMAAVTRTREEKRDIAVALVGTVAYLATRHGDDVAMLYGPADAPLRIAPGRSDAHLERMLRAVDTAVTPTAPAGNLGQLLAYAARTITRRMILVCVSDEAPLDDPTLQTLRRLRARHDILWLSVGDSELAATHRGAARRLTEISTGRRLPDFVLGTRGVRAEAIESRDRQRQDRAERLDRAGISHALIHSDDDVLAELIALLSRRGYARG